MEGLNSAGFDNIMDIIFQVIKIVTTNPFSINVAGIFGYDQWSTWNRATRDSVRYFLVSVDHYFNHIKLLPVE